MWLCVVSISYYLERLLEPFLCLYKYTELDTISNIFPRIISIVQTIDIFCRTTNRDTKFFGTEFVKLLVRC